MIRFITCHQDRVKLEIIRRTSHSTVVASTAVQYAKIPLSVPFNCLCPKQVKKSRGGISLNQAYQIEHFVSI